MMAGSAIAGAGMLAARRYYRNWGTTKEECESALPGDELVDPPAVPSFLRETELYETGSPTVTITAPVPPKWWRNLGRRFWFAVGALGVVALVAALLARRAL